MNKELMDRASAKVAEDFPASSGVADACRSIIKFLRDQPESNLRHLTYRMLFSAAGTESPEELASSAIAYLTGDRARLLEMRFEFIDQDEIFPLTARELADARRTRVFYHPHAGVPVQDFEQHVYIYFVPFGSEQETCD